MAAAALMAAVSTAVGLMAAAEVEEEWAEAGV